uniref:S-acyltransferase n=1 Tax=Leersia perrieri TaxID=77586 RepID=A0A0D9XYC0_9ORYZ
MGRGESTAAMAWPRWRRRHGWQLPLHPLQLVGMAVFAVLVAAFYFLLGPFLGSNAAGNTILALFSSSVIFLREISSLLGLFPQFAVADDGIDQAAAAAALYVRCTAADPSDRTHAKKMKRRRQQLARNGRGGGGGGDKLPRLRYGFILWRYALRVLRRAEARVMNRLVRRSYLEQWNSSVQLDPMLPFAFTSLDDVVSPHAAAGHDISYCPVCDCEVKLRSKHCKTCDRCVDGFDHHCRWLNNCIGRRNYASFILLMFFVLLMLVIEGGTAIAIFVRCFTDSKGLKMEMENRLHFRLPKGAHAALSMVFVIFTLYSTAALGQLFFFHVVLIRKSTRKLSIRIENEPSNGTKRKDDIQINPWTLIKMSKEKAMAAAERARERIRNKLPSRTTSPMKPLPVETKRGPLNPERKHIMTGKEIVPVFTKSWLSGSPTARLSSPRRRFSGSPSPKPQRHRSNFDLRLTEVSRELESHISKQVLCSVVLKGVEDEGSSP